jgi:hypothetical protein
VAGEMLFHLLRENLQKNSLHSFSGLEIEESFAKIALPVG